MKKLLFTIGFVAMLGFASAQTQQGGILLSGSTNLSFSSTSYDVGGASTSTFLLDTRAGYFLVDNLAAGLMFSYLSVNSSDLTSFGPFARYYMNGKLFLGAGYLSQSSGGVSASSLLFEGGYPIFMGDNVAFEPTLNYHMGMGDNGANTFGVGLGFSLYF